MLPLVAHSRDRLQSECASLAVDTFRQVWIRIPPLQLDATRSCKMHPFRCHALASRSLGSVACSAGIRFPHGLHSPVGSTLSRACASLVASMRRWSHVLCCRNPSTRRSSETCIQSLVTLTLSLSEEKRVAINPTTCSVQVGPPLPRHGAMEPITRLCFSRQRVHCTFATE